MSRARLISVGVAICLGIAARTMLAQTIAPPSLSDAAAPRAQPVDGVAARIEDDILTESQVRELAAFQKLVDGQAKPRAELIRELSDQWIVEGEAAAASYREPSKEDVDRAYQELAARFQPPQVLGNRSTAAGLTEADLRRILAQQLYLSRFLDYRFRPAVEVEQAQIESYYNGEFAAQLKSRGQPVPPLEDVEDTIREVLVERAISDRAKEWLDEVRSRLKIDVVSPEDRP